MFPSDFAQPSGAASRQERWAENYKKYKTGDKRSNTHYCENSSGRQKAKAEKSQQAAKHDH
jgi:hypothetical protein